MGLAIVAIMLASWLPGDAMVRSGHISGRAEHMIAYLVLGLVCLELGPGHGAALEVTAALILFAIVMEFGQTIVPGRSATLGDAVASISGLLLGLAVSQSRCAWRRRARHRAMKEARLSPYYQPLR